MCVFVLRLLLLDAHKYPSCCLLPPLLVPAALYVTRGVFLLLLSSSSSLSSRLVELKLKTQALAPSSLFFSHLAWSLFLSLPLSRSRSHNERAQRSAQCARCSSSQGRYVVFCVLLLCVHFLVSSVSITTTSRHHLTTFFVSRPTVHAIW